MSHSQPSQDFTRVLDAVKRGDSEAAEGLFTIVYDQLRALAASYLKRERSDHTLQPTALVHEAWVNLMGRDDASWSDRSHFLATAATAMRHILINHAKAKKAAKRGGDRAKLELDEALAVFEERSVDLLALDDALTRLAALDEDQARIVELRFFGGLTVDDTARMMNVSPRTVQYEWASARAWLRGELADVSGEETDDA